MSIYILTDEFLSQNIIKKEEKKIEIVRNNVENFYTLIEIPKKDGTRNICSLKRNSELYQMQKNIQKNFLSKIPLPMCVKGFRKKSSYADFLKIHTNQKFYMRIDIKDFFGSITERQIRENLLEFVKTEQAMESIIDLCTYNGTLPQGAVTSPVLSNIIFRRIDQRITKYCQKLNVIYTRYADDLIFSSNQINFKVQKWFYKKIKYILKENGFQINEKKMRKQEQMLTLNGFVVNEEISLSRKKLNNINKIIYCFKDKKHEGKYKVDNTFIKQNWLEKINEMELKDKNGGNIIFSDSFEFINYLCGYRSFLLEIAYANNEFNNKKVKQTIHKVEQIQKIIDSLG